MSCGALELSCSAVVGAAVLAQRCCGALEFPRSAVAAAAAVLWCPGTPRCGAGFLHSWLPWTARTFPRISPATGVARENGPDHGVQGAETVLLTPGRKNDAKSVSAFGGRESILFLRHTNPRAARRVQAHEPGGACWPAFAARRAYERGATERRGQATGTAAGGLLRHSGWRQQATVSPKLRLPSTLSVP